MAVFEPKDIKMFDTLQKFIQGYITWHLCNDRYRLYEVFENASDSPVVVKFRKYCENAHRVGIVDSVEYAEPSVAMLAQHTRELMRLE
ncbi:Trichodiene synthase [Cladobotryum mycophilum]|uniref:Trichodiene synthase n=1 Tax=Cladobotryum mycophilum TaxID=491253 RepID=A0ABR0SI64_9HYPO